MHEMYNTDPYRTPPESPSLNTSAMSPTSPSRNENWCTLGVVMTTVTLTSVLSPGYHTSVRADETPALQAATLNESRDEQVKASDVLVCLSAWRCAPHNIFCLASTNEKENLNWHQVTCS